MLDGNEQGGTVALVRHRKHHPACNRQRNRDPIVKNNMNVAE
jgi:hypothetical protein